MGKHEIHGLTCRLYIQWRIENLRTLGEGGDHESVPVRKDLVVPAGTNTLFTGGQEFPSGAFQQFLEKVLLHYEVVRQFRKRFLQEENVGAGLFSTCLYMIIAVTFDAIGLYPEFSRLFLQDRADLLLGPEVVLPLLALAVRVLSREKASFWRSQLSQDILENFLGVLPYSCLSVAWNASV